MSDKRDDIILRPAREGGSPDLLGELVAAVEKLIPAAGKGGGKWIGGKGEQEVAKAAEIRARVMSMIGELQIERDRLIQERESAKEAARQTKTQERHRHKERMHELATQRIDTEADALQKKTEALNKAIDAMKSLRDLGVEVEIEVVSRLLAM